MPNWFFNAVGMIGPVLFTWAYLQISLGNWTGAMKRTHIYNLLGALAIMVSLVRFWNPAMFLLEICWAAISVYGLSRASR
jgi:hypothetical protein